MHIKNLNMIYKLRFNTLSLDYFQRIKHISCIIPIFAVFLLISSVLNYCEQITYLERLNNGTT